MPLYREEGLVLRAYKLAEADKIVVLYTRGRGKIRAVAKGVRRTKSKFGSRLEPASIVQLQLYEGRNLDIVTQAERTEALPGLRADLEAYGRASLLLEMVDSAVVDEQPNPAMYKLVTGALRELSRDGNSMVVPAFVLKLLALEGVQPLVDACVRCGRVDNLTSINLNEGGVLCDRCPRGQPLTEEARLALGDILAGSVRHVLDHTASETAQELETLAAKLVEQHTDRPLRSSTVLYEQLQSN